MKVSDILAKAESRLNIAVLALERIKNPWHMARSYVSPSVIARDALAEINKI